jgi:transposase
MLASWLLPEVPDLRLDMVSTDDQRIRLTMTSTQSTAACPLCATPSDRIHSRYQRTVTDLPWAGHVVQVQLAVRRFFCHNAVCARKIFAERLGPVIHAFARRTERLTKQLQQLAFAMSSEAAARHVGTMGMPASASTLLRLQRHTAIALLQSPRIIGIDDWSFRKGHVYGAVIVDLERHRPIDLLSDTKAETFATWLEDQPQIEVISRDRAGNFAEGATRGAPQAIQVADRWHLFSNLGDAVQRLLERHPAALRAAALAQAAHGADAAPTTAEEQPNASTAQPAAPEQPEEAPISMREQRFREVLTLHGQGHSIHHIAQTLGLNWRTVKRYVVAGELPKRGAPAIQHTSSVLPYRSYLERRWQEGYQNKTQLWQEIQAQGYHGSRSSVYRALHHLHRDSAPRFATATTRRNRYALSPRQGMWLLVRSREELTTRERAGRDALEQASAEIVTATRLAERFGVMLRQRDVAALESWLGDAQESGVSSFKQFALSLRRDEAAVRAALELEWSQGQLEAQVNRLKVIKRVGYGRASFDLLRQRVLYAPSS